MGAAGGQSTGLAVWAKNGAAVKQREKTEPLRLQKQTQRFRFKSHFVDVKQAGKFLGSPVRLTDQICIRR